jgi:hypothetical protein
VLREELSINARHRPHRSDYAQETRILHCRRKLESLISKALFRQLCCVTSRKACQFIAWELGPYDFEKGKTLALMKDELNGFSTSSIPLQEKCANL